MPKITKQTMKAKAKPKASHDAWDMTDYLSLLLYGESGSGKTTTWASFPGPILCIVCSGGKLAGEFKSINTKEHREKIRGVVCNGGDQVLEQLEEAATGKYQTVVLDHATGLQEVLLRDELGLDEVQLQKSYGFTNKDAYQEMARKTKETLFRLLSIPDCHRVIVCQEKDHNQYAQESSDESSDDSTLKPCIGGAVSTSVIKWLNPACDYILQAYKRPVTVEKVTKVGTKNVTTRKKTGEIEYCLRCKPNETFITKFRVPRGHELTDLVIGVEDSAFDRIMGVIKGE